MMMSTAHYVSFKKQHWFAVKALLLITTVSARVRCQSNIPLGACLCYSGTDVDVLSTGEFVLFLNPTNAKLFL